MSVTSRPGATTTPSAAAVDRGLDRDRQVQVGPGHLQASPVTGQPHPTEDRQGTPLRPATARPAVLEGFDQNVTLASQLHCSAFPTSCCLIEFLVAAAVGAVNCGQPPVAAGQAGCRVESLDPQDRTGV